MSQSKKRTLTVLTTNDSKSPENDSSPASPRSGKWTLEEASFANRLIVEFEAGSLLDCDDGCTLRSYLARKLNCAPMRISKKFAGQCIGKHTFTRKHGASIEKNTLLHLENSFRMSSKGSKESMKSKLYFGKVRPIPMFENTACSSMKLELSDNNVDAMKLELVRSISTSSPTFDCFEPQLQRFQHTSLNAGLHTRESESLLLPPIIKQMQCNSIHIKSEGHVHSMEYQNNSCNGRYSGSSRSIDEDGSLDDVDHEVNLYHTMKCATNTTTSTVSSIQSVEDATYNDYNNYCGVCISNSDITDNISTGLLHTSYNCNYTTDSLEENYDDFQINRSNLEAKEWRDVLAYFCGSSSSWNTTPEQIAAGMNRMIRIDQTQSL